MPNPSSSESEQNKELASLQASLAIRLVYPERSIDLSDLDQQELDRAAETLIRKRLSQTRSLHARERKVHRERLSPIVL